MEQEEINGIIAKFMGNTRYPQRNYLEWKHIMPAYSRVLEKFDGNIYDTELEDLQEYLIKADISKFHKELVRVIQQINNWD